MFSSPGKLAFVFAAALLFACAGQGPENPVKKDRATIRDAVVELEIVSTPLEKQRGLGYRDELAWDRGMLFEYTEPGFVAIWMKGMRFDIDIVWIRNGRIVDIAHRVPHRVEDPLPIYRPREVADTVLEVPAGYAQAHGWRAGDAVRIERDPGPETSITVPIFRNALRRAPARAIPKKPVALPRVPPPGLFESVVRSSTFPQALEQALAATGARVLLEPLERQRRLQVGGPGVARLQ